MYRRRKSRDYVDGRSATFRGQESRTRVRFVTFIASVIKYE